MAPVTACYFIDQDGDDATMGVDDSASDYAYMRLLQVSGLNDVVAAMNTAANTALESSGKVYFTAGNPTTTHLPSLFGENLEYKPME